ncbi:D-ribose pyranase [Virgibacillus siamensis]|uniref:D-ribose pyranase n=1 Tax=Virgibacillus siamensis TaxID=480071 RepID=UPI0009854C18|nr:D-ribose pyranase [Virgibacillus siamensis]
MKKAGILNRDIASVLSQMGHTDTLVIADCGLPVPKDKLCIDVSLKLNVPGFRKVLETVAEDMVIEEMVLAEEIRQSNLALHNNIQSTYRELPIRYISHKEFKRNIKDARAVIRTGEASPFANVILKSGVLF